ncbi:hypothetical protein C2845_PM11G01880 [Panicum miliaceum]|uniref:Uncharacterized protein n=1 Tax=Panicum miliaceum TaxID=4540 RepID=A0A3L6RSK9_PANMI|nr:hypothetical protein C2845_PM11G01880 [Panicum miliaceum]
MAPRRFFPGMMSPPKMRPRSAENPMVRTTAAIQAAPAAGEWGGGWGVAVGEVSDAGLDEVAGERAAESDEAGEGVRGCPAPARRGLGKTWPWSSSFSSAERIES